MKSILQPLVALFDRARPTPPQQGAKRAIEKRVCCRLELPLRTPRQGERAETWQCVQCGYRYVAVVDQAKDPELLANIRPASMDAQRDNKSSVNEDTTTFVDTTHAEHERRGAARTALETILLVTPLDKNMERTGESFLCHTADFSTSGVKIMHPEPVSAEWLILEHLTSNNAQVRVLVKVMRVEQHQERCNIAAKFVTTNQAYIEQSLDAPPGNRGLSEPGESTNDVEAQLRPMVS